MPVPISRLLERWSLRRHQFSGEPAVLDALYDRADPWKLKRREQPRFIATNALIRENCPPVRTLLEIGCGEGAQTCHFRMLARHITGIDISPSALARARVSVPDAIFLEGTLGTLRSPIPYARYDIATLCEVLVYGNRQQQLIADVQEIADNIIVTNFEPQSRALAHLFVGTGWRELKPIEVGAKHWRAYFWSRLASRQPRTALA